MRRNLEKELEKRLDELFPNMDHLQAGPAVEKVIEILQMNVQGNPRSDVDTLIDMSICIAVLSETVQIIKETIEENLNLFGLMGGNENGRFN